MLRKLRSYANQLMALRAERGPYRFLVRRWDELSDIDLAARVLSTEFFEKEIEPAPLPVEKFKSILVISPHQDDETIGAGGTLLLAAAAGVRIDVLYTTDGDSEHQPHTSTRDEYVRIRDEEARQVCSHYGANIHNLNISNTDQRPTLDDLDEFARIICELSPDLILIPWVLDAPAKHRFTNHLLWLAHQRKTMPNFEVWGFQVHNTLLPNGYVDITKVADEKRELLRSFYSQNEHSVPFDHLAMGMAAWNARFLKGNTERSFVEVFFALPLYEIFRLVEKFYFTDLQATYRGHSHVIPGAVAIHNSVLAALGKKTTLDA